MKEVILFFSAILLVYSCSQKEQIKYCTPLNSVELLINNPKPRLSKLGIHYYEIYDSIHPIISSKERKAIANKIANNNENFVYFGYWNLTCFLNRTMEPIYKTDKKEFYEIYNNTSAIKPFKIDSLINQWYINKNPQFINDSIKSFPRTKIKLLKNKTSGNYDVLCNGSFEFYYNKMEKSNELGVDSIMNHYTIKKTNFKALVEEGQNVKWLIEL